QTYGDLVSREGKDKLRAETLAEIEGALTKYHGKGGIEEVYFTSFVIQ
ncbi:flagellar basal body-associated FliL family protein, partial [Pseudomonadota bacterium]